MKLPTVQLSALSRYFIPHRSKYSPQHPVLKHPQSTQSPTIHPLKLSSNHCLFPIFYIYPERIVGTLTTSHRHISTFCRKIPVWRKIFSNNKLNHKHRKRMQLENDLRLAVSTTHPRCQVWARTKYCWDYLTAGSWTAKRLVTMTCSRSASLFRCLWTPTPNHPKPTATRADNWQ
jgi:hypothetical protein